MYVFKVSSLDIFLQNLAYVSMVGRRTDEHTTINISPKQQIIIGNRLPKDPTGLLGAKPTRTSAFIGMSKIMDTDSLRIHDARKRSA